MLIDNNVLQSKGIVITTEIPRQQDKAVFFNHVPGLDSLYEQPDFFLFTFPLILNYEYMHSCVSVWACVHINTCVPNTEKRVSDLLEQELQVVMSCLTSDVFKL